MGGRHEQREDCRLSGSGRDDLGEVIATEGLISHHEYSTHGTTFLLPQMLARSRPASSADTAGNGKPRIAVVANWDDVRRTALALPETSERTGRMGLEWKVKEKGFVWERPLGKKDIQSLGADAPDGAIMGAHVADLGVKAALIADNPDVYFTTPHFEGYAAILVRLGRIDRAELDELITDAWLLRAPKRLARTYLDGH
jgi:hypothetical protein